MNRVSCVCLIVLFCLSYSAVVTANEVDQIEKYVALHGAETDFNLEKAEYLFKKASEAGFTGVRTDIAWSELQPEQNHWNEDRFVFYQRYI